MAKRKGTRKRIGRPRAMVAPVPVTPDIAAAVAVERQRGDGPTCPECDSGMTCNGTATVDDDRYPAAIGVKKSVRYYKCMNGKCGYTMKRVV